MTQEDFLDGVNRNVDRIHGYQLGYDGSNGTSDCIGLIIGAVRLCGEKWPWKHGSNYAARNRINNLHYVSSVSEQKRGDIVFKAWNPGDPKWDLPSDYNNSKDQHDYYHVGVVTSTSPFCITHCTGVAGGIQKDNELGRWHYAGELNIINYNDDEKEEGSGEKMYDAKVVAEKGNTVNMRNNPSTNASILKAVPIGTIVQVIEDNNNGWSKIETDGKSGYMMSKFLQKVDGEAATEDDDTVVVIISKQAARELFAALGTSLGV